MKKYTISTLILLLFCGLFGACSEYLDVVPDNVATIDNAFATRHEAEKYLFTCYSYIPKNGNLADDPAMNGGDELWRFETEGAYFMIAKGFQNVVGPYGDRWVNYFRAIHDCNIFLENIHRVPDMEEPERQRWIAEVTFLKAYYHFTLIKMYGPIPLLKENVSTDVEAEVAQGPRLPVDEGFAYVVQLLDEAAAVLPRTILDPARELGRITRPIALALKAKVLVTAASPLFNGNADQAQLRNPDGTALFNPTFSEAKWEAAAEACREAIEACEQEGMKLYYYQPDFQQYAMTDTIVTQLSIRNSVTERWNTEIIWANTQSWTGALQAQATPRLDPANLDMTAVHGQHSPPLHIVEMFYSEHGVPINEDKDWDYENRYNLKVAGDDDRLYIRNGYTTASMNFAREPRFYASMGFDGGIWYGQGRYDDQNDHDLYHVEAKYRQRNGFGKVGFASITGYFLKKIVHFENVLGSGNDYSINDYPFPVMRLADLYLLYAEALNEVQGPVAEVHKYLDLVRERAGLAPAREAWSTYSSNPGKPDTKTGMREIIRRERLIELAFEGKRFWDVRRWKTAADLMNSPIRAWDLRQINAKDYYRPTVIYNPSFGLKDYFWPIRESDMNNNPALVQNLGW